MSRSTHRQQRWKVDSGQWKVDSGRGYGKTIPLLDCSYNSYNESPAVVQELLSLQLPRLVDLLLDLYVLLLAVYSSLRMTASISTRSSFMPHFKKQARSSIHSVKQPKRLGKSQSVDKVNIYGV
jgi:hypothetical protein